MNAFELHRKLLYNGYSDVADYLKNSPVNRFIYKNLLGATQRWHLDNSIIELFNEIYYQCVRIQYDPHPGVDIEKRYLKAEELWLGSHEATMLVFEIVWVLLLRKRKQSFHDECFLEQAIPLLQEAPFGVIVEDMMFYMASEGIITPNEFEAMPCPISEIPLNPMPDFERRFSITEKIKLLFGNGIDVSDRIIYPWSMITDSYSANLIESYLRLYTTKEDQKELLLRIDKECPFSHLDDYKAKFDKLRVSIENGNYLPQTESADTPVVKDNPATEEDDDSMPMSWLKGRYKFDESTGDVSFTIAEMVNHVKECFSRESAAEFVNMFYHLSLQHGLDEKAAKLVDSIIPAITNRDKGNTHIDIPSANHVYINPKEVNNHNHVEEVNHEREEK